MTTVTEFYNPNHDARGRFARSSGAEAVGSNSPSNWWRPPGEEYGWDARAKAAKSLLRVADRIRPTMTLAERVALLDYAETFQGAHAINTALKGGPLYTAMDGQRQPTIDSIHRIEEVFARTPVNKTPLMLMRGVGGRGDAAFGEIGSLADKVISSDALTSTSMELGYAGYAATATTEITGGKPDTSTLMVMYAQPGTIRALPISDVLYGDRGNLVRPSPGLEVLLPPGSKVKVHSDLPNDYDSQQDGRIFDRVLVCEVLPEDPAYKPRYSVREGVTLFFNPAHDKRGRFATTGTGARGRFSADPDDSYGLKASLNMGPVKSEQKLTGGMSGAFVSRATTQDDRDVVVKMTLGPATADREYLSARVNDALDGSPVHVARLRADMIVSDYIDGPTGYEWGEQQGDSVGAHFAASKALANRMPGAREMGLLDKITANHDRHAGNWVVKDGRVYPIDNGDCQYWEGKGYDDNGVFAERVTGANAHINPLYQTSELVALRPKVEALAPEFARLGHPDWHQNMMGRMDAVISNRMEMDAAAVQRAADMKEFGLTE